MYLLVRAPSEALTSKCIFNVIFLSFSQPPRYSPSKTFDFIVFYIFVLIFPANNEQKINLIEQKWNYRGEQGVVLFIIGFVCHTHIDILWLYIFLVKEF